MPVLVSAREKILDHDAYAHATSSPLDDREEAEEQPERQLATV